MGMKFGVANGFLRQRTLKNSIHCSGIGLHSGVKVNMTLHPAEAGTGIRFRRNGTVQRTEVAASWRNAIETPLNTTLKGDSDIKIGTVEHLLSALSGCAIDNVVVELNGPEVPVMDGSSAPFVFLIECAGTVIQDAPRRALEIRREITVSDSRRSATATAMPGRGLSIDFEIDFDRRRNQMTLLDKIEEYFQLYDIIHASGIAYKKNKERWLKEGKVKHINRILSDEYPSHVKAIS